MDAWRVRNQPKSSPIPEEDKTRDPNSNNQHLGPKTVKHKITRPRTHTMYVYICTKNANTSTTKPKRRTTTNERRQKGSKRRYRESLRVALVRTEGFSVSRGTKKQMGEGIDDNTVRHTPKEVKACRGSTAKKTKNKNIHQYHLQNTVASCSMVSMLDGFPQINSTVRRNCISGTQEQSGAASGHGDDN